VLFSFVAIVLIATPTSFADKESGPIPFVTAAPGGRFYFKMVPDGDREAGGNGFLYLVGNKKDELLYTTSGWYSFQVFVSSDGQNICRVGNTGRIAKASTPSQIARPPEEHIAVAFYTQGKLTTAYTVAELVPDSKSLHRSFSHYSFLQDAYFHTETLSGEQQVAMETGDSHGYWIVLEMVDGETHVFDMKTGKKVGGIELKHAFAMSESAAAEIAAAYIRKEGFDWGQQRALRKAGDFQYAFEYEKDGSFHRLLVNRKSGEVNVEDITRPKS
jgi:hypothetical protein